MAKRNNRWRGTTKAARQAALQPANAARRGGGKLSPKQTAAILRLGGTMPQRLIAEKFGVTQACVCRVLRNAGMKLGSGRRTYTRKGT